MDSATLLEDASKSSNMSDPNAVVARRRRSTLNLFVVDNDVSFFFYFVALHQLAALDDTIAVWTEGLLLDATTANTVDLVETDPLRPGGRKQAHRNSDEPERAVPLPNC